MVAIGGNIIGLDRSQSLIRVINPYAVKTIVGIPGHTVNIREMTNSDGQYTYDYNGLSTNTPISDICAFTVDMNGILYFICRTGDIFNVIGETFNFIINISELGTVNSTARMACDTSNNIYVCIDKTIYNITSGESITVDIRSIYYLGFTSCGEMLITDGINIYTVNNRDSALTVLINGIINIDSVTTDEIGNIYFSDGNTFNMYEGGTGNILTLARYDKGFRNLTYTTKNSLPVIYFITFSGDNTIYQMM